MTQWWCTDDALMMHWWCTDDALMMLWWCTVDALIMHWSCTDDELMMHCWCTDDVLKMHWRCTDHALIMHWGCSYDVLMMRWWCSDDNLVGNLLKELRREEKGWKTSRKAENPQNAAKNHEKWKKKHGMKSQDDDNFGYHLGTNCQLATGNICGP